MFEDIYEAIAWEKILKKWSRKKKEAVIRGDWATLPDLSKKDFSKRKRNSDEEQAPGLSC
jgi:putative endonuclease